VLYTSGMALVILAIMIYFIELRNKSFWADKFCDIFGKNPLFIFMLNGLIPRAVWLIRIPNKVVNGKMTYLNPWSWFYVHVCKPAFSNPYNGSLLFAVCFTLLLWLIAFWMYKKKIYIKI
jgi:predicted acyltransferase